MRNLNLDLSYYLYLSLHNTYINSNTILKLYTPSSYQEPITYVKILVLLTSSERNLSSS